MKRAIAISCALFAASAQVHTATIVVDPQGAGDYTEIQPAIDVAADADTVLVRPGTYVITESIDFNRLHDPDDPTSPPVKNLVVLSEAGPEETRIRCDTDEGSAGRVVVFKSGENGESVFEGFTLSEGREGGVECSRSSPRFGRCVIINNSTVYLGGGVRCSSNAAPSFTDCTIANNSAGVFGGGGAVSCWDASPSFTNCTISGNAAGVGGGVHCHSASPSFIDCTISGNSALDRKYRAFGSDHGGGGGIYCWDASPSFTNCTISGNAADVGGGVYCFRASPSLTSCIVWDNAGGAIEARGPETPRVTYSCVEGSELWPGEGNIRADPLFCGWTADAEIFVDSGAFETGDGGSARPFRDLSTALSSFDLGLDRSSPCIGAGSDGVDMGADHGVGDGPSASAAVLYLSSGRYPTGGGIVLSHRASIQGEGRSDTIVEGTVSGLRTGAFLADLTVTAGRAGGLRVGSEEAPDIRMCTIEENSGHFGGGVFCGDSAAPTFTNCSIANNAGSGVLCVGNALPTFMGCTISGNSVFYQGASDGPGGGVYCSDMASPSFTNCMISGNEARLTEGGGVSCFAMASPSFTNCTIAGNYSWMVGGVSCGGHASPSFMNCTVSGNSTLHLVGNINPGFEEGVGGVSCADNASPSFVNCIVWANEGVAVEVSATSTSRIAHSCIESAEPWPGEGNIRADPLFAFGAWEDCDASLVFSVGGCIPNVTGIGAVISWRRWVFDDHLQPGSPCVDAGTSEGAPTFDFDGNGRSCGGGVDMGAYEMGDCPLPTTFLRGDCNDDGAVDISDASCLLNWLFLGGPAPGCLAVADMNTEDAINITDATYLLNFLFLGGPPLPPPYPDCGTSDLSSDEALGCLTPPEGCP